MAKFTVEFEREWTETGEVTVEADSEDEARELGQQMLDDDDTSIVWHGHNMTQGETHVSVSPATE